MLYKLLREKLHNVTEIPQSVIGELQQKKLFHIWVPKTYGGLGLRLEDGLSELFNWSKIDGSLGWMLTLCAGANYFSRNLKPTIAKELFTHSKTCFGGSGMVGGTAEVLENGNYLVNGFWHYATGAPYLSHFTLNAKIVKNGVALRDEEGNESIKSFIVQKNQVEIIPNWKSMGMKATGTYSFKVENIEIKEDFTFVYNTFYTNDEIDKIPFGIFADLTLLVNYLGMASHFVEEAMSIKPDLNTTNFNLKIEEAMSQIKKYANEIEFLLHNSDDIGEDKQGEIHDFGCELLKKLSHDLLDLYFQLGIKATHLSSPIHQVYCDFFTATQHANFRF